MGETKRVLTSRVKEHREEVEKLSLGVPFTRGNRRQSEKERSRSAITDHVLQSNHIMDWDSAKIVQREENWFVRGVKESIWIRKTPDNINRDEGRHILPHLYDDLLLPGCYNDCHNDCYNDCNNHPVKSL